MKVYLLHRDRDADLEQELPANAEALKQDLELNTLFHAMARGDEYLRALAEKLLLSGLTDPEEIGYRQQILADCLEHPAIVRQLYELAVEALESKKKARHFWFRDSPDALLYKSLAMLELLAEALKRVRSVADEHAAGFRSDGFRRLFATLEEELDDDYLDTVDHHLRELLGPDQFVELLESRAVSIRGDGWALGEVGDADVLAGRGPLPPLSFSLAPLVPVPQGREEHISRSLGEIRSMPLGKKTSQRVRLAIVDALTPFPNDPGRLTMDQLPTDLTMRLDLVRAATDWALREYGNRDPVGVEYDIRLVQEDEDVFRAETSIGEAFGLELAQVDRVIERAVLAVGGLNERFEQMAVYNAVTGLRETELQLVDAKLTALSRSVSPEQQELRLLRVLELANLPDPDTAEGTVNVERLLEARQGEEIREFRQWLRTLNNAGDDEIRERLESVRERIAAAVHGPRGKAVRFAATAAADLLPFGGTVAGIALSALDAFVLEKVLPEPGPVSFLGSTYRSLFDG